MECVSPGAEIRTNAGEQMQAKWPLLASNATVLLNINLLDMRCSGLRDQESAIAIELSRRPPRSGRMETFPEVDRAEWFTPLVARKKLVKGQVEIIDALLGELMIRSSGRLRS
jgi:hypothetical protein